MVMYTERNVETAQCMWEEFNNWLCEDDAKAVAIVEGVGTPEVRYVLRSEQIIAACERGWEMFEEHGQQEHMLSYDWTYVPWFMRYCLELDTSTHLIYLRDNWEQIVMDKIAAFRFHHDKQE